MFLLDLQHLLVRISEKCQPAAEADATRGRDHDPRVTQDATLAQGIVYHTLKSCR